jgi:ABC-2 type transport system ATP-binding protein
MMNLSAVQIVDLTVVRRGGRLVLDRLTLDVASGSVTGLIGPSGGGKTTLIRAIAGVQHVRSGRVVVLGRPAGAADLRSRVGYATQTMSVYPDLTVEQNLRYFATIAGADQRAIDDALRDVELAGRRGALTGNLSGGQRARVSLAAALLGEPELLLLDEPTVGLDPVLRRQLWQLFQRLADSGITLLVSSHVMDEAARCERVLLLRDGRLVADDTPDGLRRHTGQDDLEQAFLVLAEQAATERAAS